MPAGSSGQTRSDIARLRDAIAATLAPALILAFLSLALLLGLTLLLGRFLPARWVPDAALAYLHAVFIVAVGWKAIHPERPLSHCVLKPGFVGGALLTIPIMMFALLDLRGASYACADGALAATSAVPNLPWLWIGWVFLNVVALPSRCAGLAIGEMPPLLPVRRRLLLTASFVPIVLLSGLVFEWRTRNCAPPFEGWGFMEGGVVLIPLVGLFWFVLSFSMAALSAVFVDQDRLGAPAVH